MGPRGPRPGGGPGGHGGPGGPSMSGEKAKNSKGTVLRLLKYISKFKVSLFFVILLVCISAAANLGGTYLLKPIINAIGQIGEVNEATGAVMTFEQMAPEIVKNIVMLLVLYILGAVANWGQTYILASVSQNTVKEIRMDMFERMELLPLRFFDSKTHGELMSRTTNDVDAISQTLSMSVAQIFSSIITLVGTLIMMLVLSVPLTVVTLVIIPIMLFCTRTIAKFTRRYYGAQQAALGEMNGHIEETVTGQYA
ncbi:MAG: ABC transporter ATP-binding protein, partial [Clostridia bacterium]